MIGNILNIALLLVLGISIVLAGKNKVYERVAEYIDLAEDYSKVGSEKFNWCVSQLRKLLPKPLQMIFTDKIIGEIVDNTYKYMRSLAKKRIAELADQQENIIEEVNN